MEKRALVPAAMYSLALVMRSLLGVRTPKGLWARLAAILRRLFDPKRALHVLVAQTRRIIVAISLIIVPARGYATVERAT